MTVAELIERLSKLPPDLDVMADDYEQGRYDVTDAKVSDAVPGRYRRHVVIV